MRSIGRLAILSKASLAVLALVPILAAVWPAVRGGINRYNVVINDARQEIEAAEDRLEIVAKKVEQQFATNFASAADKTPIQSVMKDSHRVRRSMERFVKDLDEKTIESKDLPVSWAIAFFASLSVVVGRCIFQIFCPETIKAQSADEYANAEAESYSKAPSDEVLTQALNGLPNYADPEHEFTVDPEDEDQRIERRLILDEYRASDLKTSRLNEMVLTYGEVQEFLQSCFSSRQVRLSVPKYQYLTIQELERYRTFIKHDDPCGYELEESINSLEKIWKKINATTDDLPAIKETEALNRRVAIVRRHASKHYEELSKVNGNACNVCFISYLVAVCLFAWIVAHQSWSVLLAAGVANNLFSSWFFPFLGFLIGMLVGLLILSLIVFSTTVFTRNKWFDNKVVTPVIGAIMSFANWLGNDPDRPNPRESGL